MKIDFGLCTNDVPKGLRLNVEDRTESRESIYLSGNGCHDAQYRASMINVIRLDCLTYCIGQSGEMY